MFRTRKRRPALGVALRKIRQRGNLSQQELGESLCWSRIVIAQYESGSARPSAERLIALLRLAATDDERRPILKELEAYGVLASDLRRNSISSISAEAEENAISGADRISDMAGTAVTPGCACPADNTGGASL